ncbi:MAG: ATP-binding cassette domain-containing protein [bacterium]
MKIEIENLSFRYQTYNTSVRDTLSAIHLRICQGEFVALVGPSGSGKTTLMQHLTGLLKPDSGRVLIDNIDIWDKRTNLTSLRKKIGLVFQFPEKQLFEDTVYAEIAFGPKNLAFVRSEIEQRVQWAMQQVELDFEHFQARSPYHLSEGEKRRVAIASILAMDPGCLILDEPTASLDRSGVRAISNILKKVQTKGKTVILISHNLDLVYALADRIVVINQGKISFDGKRDRLFENQKILTENGLTIPRIWPVITSLNSQRVIDSRTIYSLDDLKNEISKAFGHDLK